MQPLGTAPPPHSRNKHTHTIRQALGARPVVSAGVRGMLFKRWTRTAAAQDNGTLPLASAPGNGPRLLSQRAGATAPSTADISTNIPAPPASAWSGGCSWKPRRRRWGSGMQPFGCSAPPPQPPTHTRSPAHGSTWGVAHGACRVRWTVVRTLDKDGPALGTALGCWRLGHRAGASERRRAFPWWLVAPLLVHLARCGFALLLVLLLPPSDLGFFSNLS